MEAIAFVQELANKGAVMKSLAHGLRFPNIEDAVEGYQSMTGLYQRRIYPNVEGLRNVIRLLGAGKERIRRIKAEDMVDERFVRKLEKEGRF